MSAMKQLLRLAAIAIISAASVACTPKVEYVQTALPLPPPPILPTIPADELQCLSDDAYKALVLRDLAQKQYIELLASIIKSTSVEADKDGN